MKRPRNPQKLLVHVPLMQAAHQWRGIREAQRPYQGKPTAKYSHPHDGLQAGEQRREFVRPGGAIKNSNRSMF